MKKISTGKLVLNRKTLRALTRHDLGMAAGGAKTDTNDPDRTRVMGGCPWTTRDSNGLPCPTKDPKTDPIEPKKL